VRESENEILQRRTSESRNLVRGNQKIQNENETCIPERERESRQKQCAVAERVSNAGERNHPERSRESIVVSE